MFQQKTAAEHASARQGPGDRGSGFSGRPSSGPSITRRASKSKRRTEDGTNLQALIFQWVRQWQAQPPRWPGNAKCPIRRANRAVREAPRPAFFGGEGGEGLYRSILFFLGHLGLADDLLLHISRDLIVVTELHGVGTLALRDASQDRGITHDLGQRRLGTDHRQVARQAVLVFDPLVSCSGRSEWTRCTSTAPSPPD